MAFTVQEFRGLMQILEQHPEWRSELRRLVLTEELLTLPQIVRELVEAQHRTEERVNQLIQQVERRWRCNSGWGRMWNGSKEAI